MLTHSTIVSIIIVRRIAGTIDIAAIKICIAKSGFTDIWSSVKLLITSNHRAALISR